MNRHLAAILTTAVLALALSAEAGGQALARSISQQPSPSLVVVITVDQLRPEYLDRWRPQFTGGLRRLLDEGAVHPNGFHDHAITETAPGHASLLSGRFPYSTGIASNAAGVASPESPLVGSAGAGASPFRFIGTTLADWMASADPRTQVLSVSRKDRGAILPIGRGKFPVFWYAPTTGRFVTSSWYAATLPDWVQRFNAEDRVSRRYAGRVWSLLLPEASYPEPDSVAGEQPSREISFPHAVPADSVGARSMITSFPWMDDMTLDLAMAGVLEMGLGGGPQTDLLAISLSTTDAVGHRWGPDSRELHDQVLRLDRSLGSFLDSLITLRGADRIVVVLTSDHGVGPSPDVRSTWGDNRKATRVFDDHFDRALAAVSPRVQRSGIPPTAFTFDGQVLEVDRRQTVGKERQLRDISIAFAREARRVPGVQRADVIGELARADTVRDATARRWLHMFRPGGDVLVAITLDPFNIAGQGNTGTHGTPHDYDARVPIIFWGRPFAARHIEAKSLVVDIGPTLAHMLGITPAERTDGKVLTGVFAVPGR